MKRYGYHRTSTREELRICLYFLVMRRKDVEKHQVNTLRNAIGNYLLMMRLICLM